MDPIEIVRQMLADGASEAEIVQSLEELGIENAQKIVADAKAKASPKQVQAKPQPKAALEEEEGESLFDEPKKPAPSRPAREEIPELEITKVSDEGEEETVDIESMLGKNKLAHSLSSGGQEDGESAPLSIADGKRLKAIEDKLDNLISLAKALQDLNKKILDAEREQLLRAGEAKPSTQSAKPSEQAVQQVRRSLF